MNGTQTIATYQRLTVVFAAGLITLTWKLWSPPASFPQIPLFSFLINAPGWIDWLAILIGLAALIMMSISVQAGMVRSLVCWLFVGSLLVLMALNQHRGQPWAYQFAVIAIVLSLGTDGHSLSLLRAFVISIYIYSAIGKFDYQFLHTVGQQFLSVLTGFLSIDEQNWPAALRIYSAASFPAFELAIGIGLVFRRTRRLAAIGAVVMHTALILILGPWGLNHQWGVIAWNFYFALQAIVLFGRSREPGTQSDANLLQEKPNSSLRNTLASFCVAGAIVLPLGERRGLVDHWFGWALYAPHSSRVVVEIAASAIDRLPPDVRPFAGTPSEGELWIEIPISDWSLTAVAAPIYPQARFQLGVAEHLAEKLSPYEIRVSIQTSASRWTGARRQTQVYGLAEIQRSAQVYWLNTHPRPVSTNR